MRFKQSIISIGLFYVFVIGTLPGIAAAQEKKKLYTLEKSIAAAMAENWALKAKEENVHKSIHVKNQARAEFLPKLSVDYNYTRQSEAREFRSTLMAGGSSIAISSLDNFAWRGTLKQPVFTGFSLSSSYQLAKLGIDQSEMELELEKLDLALRVKEAYFNILIADKAIEVAKSDLESRESSAKVARNFYKVGMIPINDLLQAEVELANAQQNLVNAQNTAMLNRSTFNIVLSKPINEPVEVEDILGYEPERGDFQAYLKNATENRPEIKLIDNNILQTNQQVRIAKSKNYPEVALTYNYIKEGDTPDVSGSTFHDKGRWEAMATVSWTFWEWGKTYYSAKEKESLRKELIQTKMATEDRIKLELKEALLALGTAEKNIPTTQQTVEQGEENLRVSQERYKAQVTTITEVLDAQTRLTQTKMNYFRALYNHHLAQSRLERAMGTY